MQALKELMSGYQNRVETALHTLLPSKDVPPQQLHEAMHYSTFNGGKRVRPVLVYATGAAFGVDLAALDAPACGVELVHSYSLVHDDMPAMDDDDLRRGKPTCHKQYNEATALLVGDALQTQAFELLATNDHLKPEQNIKMIGVLAKGSGSLGMAGGQAIDLASVGKALSLDELRNMHSMKTGALIKASVAMGALAYPDIDEQLLAQLDTYAGCIGLSFQIQDDILDIESDTQTLGKPQGSDIEQNKPTYPALLGLDGAKQMANECHQEALASLSSLDDKADPLRWLSEYIISRRN